MAEPKKTKRTYQGETLGLPPLKMVLVHAENDRRNAAQKPLQKKVEMIQTYSVTHDDLMRLIEHLKKE